MYFYLFQLIVLSQQCLGIFINITNGENTPQGHSDKAFKLPDGMMSDQGDHVSSNGDPVSSDVMSGYIDLWSKYIYSIETTPIPLHDMIKATEPPKVMNEDETLISSNQPESQVDLVSSKDHVSSNGDPVSSDLMSGYIDLWSKYIYGIETTPIPLHDMIKANVPPKVMNEDEELISSNQPESQVDLGSSKELLNHLSNNNIQDVENFTVNQLDSQVDVDVGSPEELYHPPNNINTQDVSGVSKEFSINQPESRVEVDVVDNEVVALWVAALLFIIIALYAVIFIIAVALLECKGKGRRTVDDEKYGFPVEKEKLLNGAAISEDTKDYQIRDEFESVDKSYTNAALQLENSTARNYNHSQLLTDRTDLHHLLGSPVAEVEVFTHGSLQRPPKKGCLQY